jgi:protein-tyrosine phosphatase
LTSRRVLLWDGCVNVRDLGGLPTEDGRETRFGSIVRADQIASLTDEGWRAVQAYGVRVAVDLRADDEVADDPPRDVPIRVVHIPVSPREAAVAYEWPSMLEAYLALLAHFRREFAAAVETIGREDEPIVVHCQGGRDRTGLMVALLLRLAGVAPVAIAADHALSDESWSPFHAEWFAAAPDERERARRRRIVVPAGETMSRVLAELERRYGGPRDYLLGGGADPGALESAVRRLREP